MGERIRTAVVVGSFPSETFVIRQVQALGAEVATGVTDPGRIDALGMADRVVSLTGARVMGPGRTRRALGRLLRPLGYVPLDWSARAERNWRRFLIERRPDVVLAQFGPNALRCMAGCRDAGVPLVAHFHGYDASELMRFAGYVRRLPALFEQAAGVVVVSEAMRQTVFSHGCPNGKLHRIPCGVPVEEFEPSDEVGRQPCRFLAVGRFVPKKAPLTTIRAFEHCAAEVAGVALSFIGDGPLLAEAAAHVAGGPFADCITLAGAQPIETVRREMAQAGAFLQHSITAANGDTEGWPVSIAEAAASALPVVSTRHAGIAEEVIHGRTGYLVDEHDEAGMANRMIELARDGELRRRMGAAGRAHIEAEGSFRVQARRLADLLAEAAATR